MFGCFFFRLCLIPGRCCFLLYCFVLCFVCSYWVYPLDRSRASNICYGFSFSFLFVSQAPDFRVNRVFVVDGFCVHFVSYCCYFPFFSIVSRFRGINGKKLTFERLQFCPTFVFFFADFAHNLFSEPIYGLSFFSFAVSLFFLLAARLFAPKLYLLKRLNGFWIYSLFCFWIWVCMRFLMFLVKL